MEILLDTDITILIWKNKRKKLQRYGSSVLTSQAAEVPKMAAFLSTHSLALKLHTPSLTSTMDFCSSGFSVPYLLRLFLMFCSFVYIHENKEEKGYVELAYCKFHSMCLLLPLISITQTLLAKYKNKLIHTKKLPYHTRFYI